MLYCESCFHKYASGCENFTGETVRESVCTKVIELASLWLLRSQNWGSLILTSWVGVVWWKLIPDIWFQFPRHNLMKHLVKLKLLRPHSKIDPLCSCQNGQVRVASAICLPFDHLLWPLMRTFLPTFIHFFLILIKVWFIYAKRTLFHSGDFDFDEFFHNAQL